MNRARLSGGALCCAICVLAGAGHFAAAQGVRDIPKHTTGRSSGMDAFKRLDQLGERLQKLEKNNQEVPWSLWREHQLAYADAKATLSEMPSSEDDPGAGARYRQKLYASKNLSDRLERNCAHLWRQARKNAPGTHTGGGQTKDGTTPGETGTAAVPAGQAVVAVWSTALTASKPGCETVTRLLKGQRRVKLPPGVQAGGLPSAEFTVHVYGVVRDTKGRPVGGVAVSLRGEKAGATTKADGSYHVAFKVAGSKPPKGKPEAREQVNLTIRQLFAVVPQELAFTPGTPQVRVFSIENRADKRDVTIQGIKVVGAPAGSAAVKIRRGDRVVYGGQGTRCVIGPGGFCNVEVSWKRPVGAADARIKVVPEDASLGAKTVLLRTGLTAKQMKENHQAKVIAVLQALKAIAAKPASPAPQPPLPVPDKSSEKIDKIAKLVEAILLKAAAENLPDVKAAPKPGVPENVDTTKAANVFVISGSHNHVTVFGPGTKATINPPPEKLGAQGSQALGKLQQQAGEKNVTPVHVEKGSVYSGTHGKQDPVIGYFEELGDDSFGEGRDTGQEAGTTFVNAVKKCAGTVLGTVEGVANATAATVYDIITETCSIFSWNTKYDVRHDPASHTTTVTVFEDSVEVQSFTGDRSLRTIYAGQRVSVGPQGFGKLEELRAGELAAAADLYAPAFLGLNPVSYQRTGIEQAVLAAEAEEVGPGRNRPPKAAISILPETPTVGDAIVVVSASTDPDVDPLSLTWHRDGEPLDTTEARWEWADAGAGEHTIRLVVDDGRGGRDEAEVTINVVPTGLTSPLLTVAIWAAVGLAVLLILGKLVLGSRKS